MFGLGGSGEAKFLMEFDGLGVYRHIIGEDLQGALAGAFKNIYTNHRGHSDNNIGVLV